MKPIRRSAAVVTTIAATAAAVLAASGMLAASASAAPNTPANSSSHAFIGPLHNTKVVASTIPANGDVNPYGVAVVPRSTGDLYRGDVLVSNFNNMANVQGTGTTIVQVSPEGKAKLFAQISDKACPGGVGLTTALVALRSGWVIVGSLPTKGGNISGAGCLIVLDRFGHVRETFRGGGINGPWDMGSLDLGNQAVLFVTNVLNGTVAGNGHNVFGGTVLRLVIRIPQFGLPFIWFRATIGSGFPEALNSSALVLGPTGAGLGANGTLYVADTITNRIAAIPDAVFRDFSAGAGFTVSRGRALNNPLGLVVAPNGDILTVNGGNGNLVEVTPFGAQIAVRRLDSSGSPPGAGALFGLAVVPNQRAVYFVDDATNQLDLLH